MAVIELKNVTKTFMMGKETIHALASMNLSIEAGEFVAIIGPSGCGKSTLMNIIGLLDQPTEGEFLLDGKPTLGLTDDERAQLRNQAIGFVFQNFNLLPRASALRNVEMPMVYAESYNQSLTPAKRTEQARAALEKVGLGDRTDHKPNELSGGQRQRVAIARAIVNEPKILLGDEPTGNLDSKSGKEILELFRNLHRQGVTIILVTHDPSIAAQADRTLSILDGQILHDTRRSNHVTP
jgi:putative ABC transport system ATP-binding protein